MADPFSAIDSLGAWQVGNTYGFPSPWADAASLAMPESTAKILRYAEFIWNTSPEFSSAMERVLSYWLTEVEINGELGDDEKDSYLEYLNDVFGIKQVLHTAGMDCLCYGNGFFSVLAPFKRYLACPKCKNEYPFKTVAEVTDFGFDWSDFTFRATCPHCHYRGDFGKPIDRRGPDEKVIFRSWSPHEIEIIWDKYSARTLGYLWKIPADYKSQIQRGIPEILAEANWEVIQAIKENKYLKFAQDVICHLREPPLSGLDLRGWGLPRSIRQFRQVWYLQVLRRANEAIGLDMVVPFRCITPMARGGANPEAGDPILNMNLSGFVSRVSGMLRRRQRDPAAWNILPFPISYQAIGGDAAKFAPKELMDQGADTLLNGCNVPIELYKGTLGIQTAPMALRLFEANWVSFYHQLNHCLGFVAKRLAELLSWEPVKLTLRKPSHADNADAQMLRLQLVQSQLVSPTTALKALDLDYKGEVRQTLADQVYQTEQQQSAQDRLQKEQLTAQMLQPPQQGAQGPQGNQGAQGGGAPPAPGQQPSPAQATSASMMSNIKPQTPDDMLAQAQTIASQLITEPEGQRKSELMSLRKSNPALHGLVKSMLEQMRSQMRSQGQQQIQSQMQQQR